MATEMSDTNTPEAQFLAIVSSNFSSSASTYLNSASAGNW